MAKINLHEATREQLVDGAGLRPLVAEAVLKVRDERGGEIADISALKDAVSEVKGIGPAALDQLGDVLKVSRQATKPAAETPAEAAAPAVKAGTEDARQATEATASGVKVGAEEVRRTTEEVGPNAISGVKVARQTAEETAKVLASGVKAGAEEASRTVEKTAEIASLVTRRSVDAAEQVAERTAEVTSLATRGVVEMVGRRVSDLADAEQAAVVRSSETASELSQLVARLVNEQVQANIEMLQTLARARTWREALEAQNEFFRGNIERMTSGTSRYVETVARLTPSLAGIGRGEVKRAA
jgi:phasin family protein